MPRRFPCAECGKLMWHGTGALPPGEGICRECRRSKPTYRTTTGREWPNGCARCGGSKPSSRHKFCEACRRVVRNESTVRRPQQSSTARGYGAAHQKARIEALAEFRPGDPCVRCEKPVYDPPEMLDLDHTDDRSGYLGLSHRSCNRATAGRARPAVSKVCDGCGVPFETKVHERRYCTRVCYLTAHAA